MKITIVLGAFFPVPPTMGGGVEKVWFSLAPEFVKRGHEILMISRKLPELPREEIIDGVKHLRVEGFAQPRSIVWLKFLDLVYSLRVRRVLPKSDIIVTNTFWLPVLLRGSRLGQVYVHIARYPKGQMRFYGNAARLQALSRVIANAIVAQAPRLRAKVKVLPNPLPFRISTASNPPRNNTILFVGRIHPEKGIEMLLRALIYLPREFLSTWNVNIVGSHETHLGGGGKVFFQAMEQLATQSPLQVQWLGPIFDEAELRTQYRSSIIFAYPSLAETGEAFPLAPLEAMADGCVPLVSNLSCFNDYIEDGVTGFIFDRSGGYPALSNRLAGLLRLDRNALAKIGDAARAKAAEFAIEPVAQRYLEDFASVLAQPVNE
jgi:glycosyltransferase involved in cell wall biosynthesis